MLSYCFNFVSLESGRLVAVDSPSTIVQMPSSQAVSSPTDIQALRTALVATKAENAQLVHNSELQALQHELSSLQQPNEIFNQCLKDPPPLQAQPLTMQGLHDLPQLIARADAQNQKLGLSDSSCGSDESADDGDAIAHRREQAKRDPTMTMKAKWTALTGFSSMEYAILSSNQPLHQEAQLKAM
ncbi:hypothetical protein ACROYT_G015263 [Oculina patagonica]